MTKLRTYFIWQMISASILTPKWKNTVSVTPGSVVAIVPAGYLSPK